MKKYDYVTIEATSAGTTKIIKQLNFDIVLEKKLYEFTWEGEPMVSAENPQANTLELVAAVKVINKKNLTNIKYFCLNNI